MTNKILIFYLLFTFLMVSCSKNEKKKEVKREVVTQPIIKKDTLPEVPEPEPEVEVEVVELPDNKYFLIAGSFTNENNATTYSDELIKQGYNSEVIVRRSGKNPDFYKVSYKGFSDKDEAYNQLANEQKLSEFPNVWLLIKK